jgi:hypothetical protein
MLTVERGERPQGVLFYFRSMARPRGAGSGKGDGWWRGFHVASAQTTANAKNPNIARMATMIHKVSLGIGLLHR